MQGHALESNWKSYKREFVEFEITQIVEAALFPNRIAVSSTLAFCLSVLHWIKKKLLFWKVGDLVFTRPPEVSLISLHAI